MQVLSAQIKKFEYCGQEEVRIEITTQGEPKFIYDQRKVEKDEWLLRGECGDVGDFICLAENNNAGFGGKTMTFKLKKGGYVTWKGPWSSRAGVVNQAWPDEEPLVECVDVSKGRVITHVRKSVLENLGIKLEREIKWGGEVYYKPA